MDGVTGAHRNETTTPKPWTVPQGLYAGLLGLISVGIAGPAFYAIFNTAVKLVRPYMHGQSWIVPACGEIAFAVLFGWGILLAWRKVPDVPIRVAGMALIVVLSVAIQVYAGRGSFPDAAAHLVIVGSFFLVTLTVKAAITSLRGGKIRSDRITLGEWIAQPRQSVALWRWMKIWGEPSRSAARNRYMVLLYARAITRAVLRDQEAGHSLAWRRTLPPTLRYQLATGLLPPEVAGKDWQATVAEHVRKQICLLDEAHPEVRREYASHDAPVSSPPVPEALPQARPAARPEVTREHASQDAPVSSPPVPEVVPEVVPEALPQARPAARPEAPAVPALKLPASRSRSMTPADLEPHVAAMLQAYGNVPVPRIKADLHVGTEKASEALRLARRNRRVVAIGVRSS